MKKNLKYLIPLILILIITVFIILHFNKNISIKEYSTNNFKIKYDTTWEIKDTKDKLLLEHKKTKSTINIKTKLLDESFLDTNLKDIISEITDSIISQNKDYNLISINDNLNSKYQSYSYLYEYDNEQVLVNIYKKDNTLLILYYSAESSVFDILLDSVDNIVNSIEIYSGER